jgi:hypothetical protein
MIILLPLGFIYQNSLPASQRAKTNIKKRKKKLIKVDKKESEEKKQ